MMNRYSAKLLFQFRVECDGESGRMRTCEERIVTFEARGGRDALRKAKAKGKAAQFDCVNPPDAPIHPLGAKVFFEFVGVREMVELDPVCGPDEVWYDIKRYLTPMERKDKLTPSDERILNHM